MMRLAICGIAVLLIGCKPATTTMTTRPSWIPEPPKALTEDFYRSHSHVEKADDVMWTYLCDLIPEDQRPHRVRTGEMLKMISPGLKRYFLARGFDWERGSGGLESCLMHEPEHDSLFLEETIIAYESLGAFKHAAILRELIPIAQNRLRRIEVADAKGEEFNFDDGLWDPYEKRWDQASVEFNFYDVIWQDIQTHPDRYTHPK